MYDSAFYAEQAGYSRRAAAAVLPLVTQLVGVKSVVDIGCGVGTWLAEWAALGIADYLGVDGGYVPRDQLQIPEAKFLAHDLREPPSFRRSFDLAMSLEVAEHLPESCAPAFVASLAGAAPMVLFSAAIPGQRGDGHINEQWPEYWRALFRQHGYAAVDAIRPQIWGHADVMWWYQQNTIVYASEDALKLHPTLVAAPEGRPLDIVHPALLEREPGLRDILSLQRRVPGLAVKAAVRRVRHRFGRAS